MNRRNWILTGLLLAVVLAVQLGSVNHTLAQTGTARLRILHAVPGAPNLDVVLDGTAAVSNLAYSEVTPHLTVTAGEHQIALRQAGTDASAAALLEVPVPLVDGLAYTLVVQGAADTLAAALYEDPLDPLDPGNARLTAINAVADSPALDVMTTAGGPLMQGVNYNVPFGSINIGTGAFDLVMVPAGGSVESAVAPIGPVSLQSGVLYTLVTLGTLEGDTPISTLVLTAPVNGAEGSVRVRVAHGSPDAGPVDVYAGDKLIVPALDLGQMSAHIALPAGDTTLALRPAGAAAADEPLVSADVTLDAATPAITVVALGEAADNSLALEVVPDSFEGITPEQARIAVLNAVPGATATVALTDPAGTALASDLQAGAQAEAVDVAAGRYRLTVNVAGLETPVDVVVPEMVFYGGSYYSVLVYGGGAANALIDAGVAATEVNVTPASLPAAGQAVAAAPTETEAATEETPAEVTPAGTEVTPAPAETTPAPAEVVPTGTPAVETPAVVTPLATESTELVQTTPTPGEAASEVVSGATATPTPVPTSPRPVAYVQLDPGANLHCRELPGATAKSLGLIPSGATLTVLGRTGTPLVPDTGNNPTPLPTPVVESIDQLWLSVEWVPEGGGTVRCWVSAQYLRVEFQGRLLDTLEELWELPEEPFNRPGEVLGASVAPPTPVYNAIVGVVNLDPGVSLQLRRYPQTTAESLDLVPAQAQLEILGYTVAPSEGLVGQPTDPNWLYVRYRKENEAATIGWVSAQYITGISQRGRPVAIADLPVIEATEAGYYETPGVQPVIPAEQQAIVAVVNLDPGANLNLRDRPSADARVVIGIPSGSTMRVNGRNADATWLQVTYTSETGDLEGWIASQYVVVTRGGQPVDLMILPDLSGGLTGGATPTPTSQLTLTPTPGG